MAATKKTKIPRVGKVGRTRAGATEKKLSASRAAAQNYEVIQVWIVNGRFNVRLQNVKSGDYVTAQATEAGKW